MTGSLRGRLRILLLASTATLVVVIVLGVVFAVQLVHASDELVERTQPARIAAKELEVAVLDQETGVRGLVISAEPSFLEPYERGRAAQLEATNTIEDSLRGNTEIADELAEIDARSDRWRSEVAEPALEAMREDRREDALAITESVGKTRFDAIRASLDDLNDTLERLRDQAVDDLEQSLRQLAFVGGAMVVLILALIAVVSVALRRSVLDPLTQLGGEAQLVADGDYERRFEEVGPEEIRDLAIALETMRTRIVDELEVMARARTALQDQADEIQRSNRDLEQFAYVASHDLQEPLRKVAGFCQLLERRYADQLDDTAKEYIGFAVDGAQRMQDLISDLLAFSRVGRTTDQFRPVALDEVVASAWDGTRDHEGAQLHVDVLPVVQGDETLLKTLFVNLLSNSVKFKADAPTVVEIEVVDLGESFEISIQDNGIGISPEFADRIFDIFQRLHTRDVYDGTGIGLALCKRIAEFHGGSIRLAPSDRGARFVIALPAASVPRQVELVDAFGPPQVQPTPIESTPT